MKKRKINVNAAKEESLRLELEELKDTLEAIRSGQVDALVIDNGSQHKLYTLESADRAYRVFIEHMSEGAVTLHQDGTIEYANAQFGALLEKPLPEIVGKPFADFIAVESQQPFQAIVEQCIIHQECRGEIQLCSDQASVPVQVSLSILHQGGEHRFPMIVTDLRRQKKVQLQLEDQNRALVSSNYDLQQFASVASHDLQEPLRKITTFANLLRDDYGKTMPDQMQRYLGKILNSSTRMQRLIIDVLDFSKLSNESASFDFVDLNVLVAELIEDFELVIEQKNAVVEVAQLPIIRAQPVQMLQAFRNLLSNALKFTHKDRRPHILISSTRVLAPFFDSTEDPNGQYHLFRVRDNGIGFNETYLQRIFDLFQRLHSKDEFEGTGIGLAITKKIIEQHHGFIDATAKEDEGAEFRILLPIEQP